MGGLAPVGRVRDHIKLGSWLALIALAMNLAMSFAHLHVVGGQTRDTLVAAISSSDGGQTGHDDGGLADLCPICLATMAIANAVASTPPVLPHPVAQVLTDRTIETIFAFFESPRPAFRSRAPPVS